MITRIVVSVILLPLLLVVVLVLPEWATGLLFGASCAVAAFELLYTTGIVRRIRLCAYTAVAGFWCALWCCLGISYAWLLLGLLVFWLILFAEFMLSGMKLPFDQLTGCFTAGVVLPLMLGAMVRLRCMDDGKILILLPFLISFTSDTGAYFTGKYLGKHKMAPKISPKKTVEGLLGGILCAVVGMLIFCLITDVFSDLKVHYLYALVYGIVGSLAGVFGDLCFSAVKRQTGIKDYGKLIPGHGGVLDRFDSLMIVGPFVEIMMALLPVVER